MAEKYYFDTSIWIDIYGERGYNGEVAKKLMDKIILFNDIVLYSETVIRELKRLEFSDYEINTILNIAKPDNIRRIHQTKEQVEEAKRVAKGRDVPLGDAIHAILARDHEAVLISRDRDFEKLKDITQVEIPENLV